MCSKAKEFALALAILECAIKPVAMLPVWKDSLGHTRYLHAHTQRAHSRKLLILSLFVLLLICSPSKMVYGVKISFIQKYLKSEKKNMGFVVGSAPQIKGPTEPTHPCCCELKYLNCKILVPTAAQTL